ncbi:hypothetical protein PINS_up022868 [Pythium insidiosum]|nr:hypothetical protein PINS_up022868 [Pythium insidiosum]
MKFYAWEESRRAPRREDPRTPRSSSIAASTSSTLSTRLLLFLTPVLLGAVILGLYVGDQGLAHRTEAFTLIAMGQHSSRLAVSLFPLAIRPMSQAKIAFRRMDT